jgi:hypothetical protein
LPWNVTPGPGKTGRLDAIRLVACLRARVRGECGQIRVVRPAGAGATMLTSGCGQLARVPAHPDLLSIRE